MKTAVKRLSSFYIAAVMILVSLFAFTGVEASAASLIKYSVSYSGETVKLTLTPQSSKNTVRYTTDGSKPTESSKKYKSVISAKSQTLIRAAEYDKNGKKTATLKITIAPRVQKPVITMRNGQIYITCADKDADIFYTTDGSTPKKGSGTSRIFKVPSVVIGDGVTIKARAFRDGMTPSKTASYTMHVDYCEQVAVLANAERHDRGLKELEYDAGLCKAAELRAKEIAVYFDHTRPNGLDSDTALFEYGIGYYYYGENIAAGQRTADEVVRSWMNSEGHRRNILSENFGKLGVGHYVSDGIDYWVQVFTD